MNVESVVITPDAVDHSAHDAAMIAKVEAAEGITAEVITNEAEVAPAERPEGLPEKFKDTAELVKAYTELEKKLGAPKEAVPVETPAAVEETPEAKAAREAAEAAVGINAETPPAEAAEVLKAKGLDFNKYHEAMVTNGELSEADYAELEAAGIPKGMVDGYVQGQVAIVAKMTDGIMADVGGKESYESMIEWAKTNLTPGELMAFDNSVTTTDVEQAKLAVAGLNAKYKAAVGESPKLLDGTPPGDSTDVYESNAQLTADMKTPLYKKDPAEQKRVAEKLARSQLFT